jgi:hypothetical protein
MGVPNVFGSATTSIPLSQLDQNFNTTATLGNAAIGLGNTTTTVGNLTLANVTILSGTSNIAGSGNVTIGNTTVGLGNTVTSLGNVTLANSTINFAASLSLGNSTVNTALGQGDASIMKNRIINGAMVIDQRNFGASVSPTSPTYCLDRYEFYNNASGSKYTVQQNSGSVTPPIGFTNYLGITSTSAYTVGAGEILAFRQAIEGYNVADLGWGTANAKTVTLSFQVRSSLTGTFGGVLGNGSSNYSYPFTYTISSANTWTTISVTIAGPTAGTWTTTNSTGLNVWFQIGVGSTFTGTAGSWSANGYYGATGATSVVGTNGATFYITGVQLEVGSSATGYEYRQFTTELQLAQRYFCKTFTITTPPAANTQNQGALMGKGNCASDIEPFCTWQTPVEMRTTPTVTLYAIGNSVSANNQWTNGAATATANARAGGIGLGTRQIQIDNTGNLSGSAGSQFYIQAAATAEL